MKQLLKELTDDNKRITLRSRYLLLRICCLLITAFIFAGFSIEYTQAASGLKIYDYTTKKQSTYNGKQPKVTLNGKSIGDASTPGILVNGIALLPYTDIFENSIIDAQCSYNEEKGTVSISKYDITIKMTIGSKKATLNGKTVTLPVAPMKLKYVDAKEVKVLVPSRYVAETLGLGYTWYEEKSTVAIEKKSIQLTFNDGDEFEYTGAQCSVTIDGKKVNLGSMPNIITNDTAMLRAKTVFADSKIDADYTYNKANSSVTLSKNGNKLVMTIGSNTAYLNNKQVKLDTAPILVKNCETGSSYVMVPGNFTANSLGYNYQWSNSTRTSIITSKKSSSGGSSNTDPELGDSGVVNETGTIIKQWKATDTSYGKSSGVHELNGAASTDSTGSIYAVSRDYNNDRLNEETFLLVTTAPFHKVNSSSSGNTITIQADQMGCTDQTYQVYGSSSNFVNLIKTSNNTEKNSTTIDFQLLQDNYQYDISMSEDGLILYVTVYMNAVTSAVVGTNSAGDYLTLTGLSPLKVTISEQTGVLYLDIPYTVSSLGNLYAEVTGTKYLKLLYTVSYPDKTQFVLQMNEGYTYYFMESDNQYTLILQTKGQTQEPGTPGSGNEDPETPVDIDKSQYEITIPKPESVIRSMITDEDYYFSNYFVIRIPGDYTGYFKEHTITHTSNVISSISVTANSKNETVIKIATTKLQGYEIASDNENIYINIGNPKDIYKNIVVLDPGHGGSAVGAQYNGSYEKDVNLKILYTVGKKYFNSDPSKLKVYYIRTTDVDMSLNDRAAFSKKVGADLFVSLHMNAGDSSASGTEVYYSKNNNSANSAGLTSSKLANAMLTNIVDEYGLKSRGVKSAAFVVIDRNTVPAILIELGFLSNKGDHAKLVDSTYQDIAAKTIYDTLLQVFEDYPTGR
jgi:N-acetylmuramoyl-L-alanine amidase